MTDPRHTGFSVPRQPLRFEQDGPDDAPRTPYRCRLCRDRGVYMGAATGWRVAPCPKCCAGDERAAS